VFNAGVDPGQVAGCAVDQIVDHSPPATTLKTHDAVRLRLYDLVDLWLCQHLQRVVTVIAPSQIASRQSRPG